jgi:hypothetical protein
MLCALARNVFRPSPSVRQGEVATTSISGAVMLECVGRAKDRAVEVDRLVQAAADAASAAK